MLGNHGITDLRDEEEMSEEVLQSKGINKLQIKKGARKGHYDDDDEFE